MHRAEMKSNPNVMDIGEMDNDRRKPPFKAGRRDNYEHDSSWCYGKGAYEVYNGWNIAKFGITNHRTIPSHMRSIYKCR